MPGQCRSIKCWSWRRDLNPRPSDYKSDALPTELRQQSETMSPRGRIYPSDPIQMSGTILKGTITVIWAQPQHKRMGDSNQSLGRSVPASLAKRQVFATYS